MPIMAFIGVRISWLMLARNSLFARLATSAASLATRRACSTSCRSAASKARVAMVVSRPARCSSCRLHRRGAPTASAQRKPTSLPFCLIGALNMVSTWKHETYDDASFLNCESRKIWRTAMGRCPQDSDRRYTSQDEDWNAKVGLECCRPDVHTSISSMAARSSVSSQMLARFTCNKPQHASVMARKTREMSPLCNASLFASLLSVS